MFEHDILATICYDAPKDGGAGGDDAKVNIPTDPKKEYRQVVSELKESVNQLKTGYISKEEYEAKTEKMNERLDELDFAHQEIARSSVKAEKKAGEFEHAETFAKMFYAFAKDPKSASYLKDQVSKGEIKVKSNYHPSLEQKSDNFVRFNLATSGALLMPAEMADDIIYNAIETTPIAQLVNTTRTSRPQKIRNLRVSTPGVSWVEEEGTTPKKKVTYRKVTLTPKKAAARYGATIENEQDSAHDLYAEMRRAYQEDFNVGVGTACLSGDGNGKPKGMIGELTGFNSAGQSLTSDMLIQFVETILDEYQADAQWLFTRKTRAYIRSLLVSDEATQYLWEPDFTRRQPTMLLGAPINIAREGDMAGRLTGDFTVGEVPILYGDFQKAYELCMHTDMFIIDDPYTESAEWVRNMNIMSRVDGQPMLTEAAAELRITSS